MQLSFNNNNKQTYGFNLEIELWPWSLLKMMMKCEDDWLLLGCHEVESVKKFKTDHILNNHVDA
jgi:hypothetical protein